jgi:protocatechuate 3,4-dioxygenase beta subunit
MNRKDFLRTLGGAAMLPAVSQSLLAPNTAAAAAPTAASCQFSPSLPDGPFYFDPQLFRADITESRPGVPIEYRLSVVDAACRPIAKAVVDVWQCDAVGIYSGYDGQITGADTKGMKFLRGMQRTDDQGLAKFTAIYPGWYPRRVPHLHVKIHLSPKAVLTTNLFFPNSINAEVYATEHYKARGPSPMTVAQDVELKGDDAKFNALMINLAKDGKGGYVGSYAFGISA